MYHGGVTLTNQGRLSAVSLRLWDPVQEETIWAYDLTAEEMALGEYMFRDYDLYGEEYVQSHLDLLREGYEPDPVLEVTYTFLTAGGEETRSIRTKAAYEVWIGARYDLKDPAEDFLSYFMEETTYPDSFVLRIDPCPYGDLTICYGEDAELQPGDVAVTVTVNGQTLSGEGARLEKTETVYTGGILYAYAYVIPRPASCPEQGTAELRITRRLISYPDTTRTDIKTVEYGQ